MALIPLNTFKTKTAALTTLMYNQVTCARDTSLIIDSIIGDMLQGGQTQTAFAGEQYWAQDASKISGGVFQTLAALEHAKQVALQLVSNATGTAVTPTAGNTTAQNNTLPPGSVAGQLKITEEFDLIMSIIQNGTAGTTSNIIANSDMTTDTGLLNTAAILTANKAFLQAEDIAWINATYITPHITYDKVKCVRDTKLIVDSLAIDIITGSNTQSMFAGLQYWAQGSSTIPSEQRQTLAAVAQLKTIVGQIILNEAISVSPTNILTQSYNITNPSNQSTKTAVLSNFNTIISIITHGQPYNYGTLLAPAGLSDIIVANSFITSDIVILNAYELIKQNKVFIQTEIVAWIEYQVSMATSTSIWYQFDYNTTSTLAATLKADICFRDVGYILDCVSFDLLHSGNRQSVQAGVYYYGFSSITSSIPNEISESISAYNYLKSLISDIITAQPIADIYQIDIDQVFDLRPGTNIESARSELNINLITDIIEIGPPITHEKTPISLAYQPSLSELNAAALLIANRDFLAAEVVAYVNNATLPNLYFGMEQPDKGSRDVGFIVDCIVFDMTRSGNRQATQAGVYCYTNSATVSIVPTEKVDTKKAYLYMNYVMDCVIQHVPVATATSSKYPESPYQHTALQTGGLASPVLNTDAVNKTNELISLLTDIIEIGPKVAPPRQPISLDTTLNLVYLNACAALQENKSFIVAEVIGYMNALKTPNTTKIYTAPPGITAIILMAHISNITEYAIDVTFVHYRNFPVAADPATLNGFQAGDENIALLKTFTVPPHDAASPLDGKLIIESFDSIFAYASKNAGLKIALSVLETANS